MFLAKNASLTDWLNLLKAPQLTPELFNIVLENAPIHQTPSIQQSNRIEFLSHLTQHPFATFRVLERLEDKPNNLAPDFKRMLWLWNTASTEDEIIETLRTLTAQEIAWFLEKEELSSSILRKIYKITQVHFIQSGAGRFLEDEITPIILRLGYQKNLPNDVAISIATNISIFDYPSIQGSAIPFLALIGDTDDVSLMLRLLMLDYRAGSNNCIGIIHTLIKNPRLPTSLIPLIENKVAQLDTMFAKQFTQHYKYLLSQVQVLLRLRKKFIV